MCRDLKDNTFCEAHNHRFSTAVNKAAERTPPCLLMYATVVRLSLLTSTCLPCIKGLKCWRTNTTALEGCCAESLSETSDHL